MLVQVGDTEWEIFSWLSDKMHRLLPCQQVNAKEQLPRRNQDLFAKDS
jgi:hypothetical protein